MKNFTFIKIIVLITIIGTSSLNLFSQGVVISDNTSDTPDPSAMLEIKSNSKGLLIPRMTTAERNSISSPVDGLLIFDNTEGNFYLYGQGKWNDLSTPAGIWSVQSSNVYLTNSTNNIGIGTQTPSGKFVIKADAAKADSDPLFEIQDKYGETIFSVTSEGARLYVKDMGKGVSGGFAVGQYGTVKGKAAGDEFFIVTPDSTRVYSLPGAKGVSGGFAVGQYGTVKGGVRNTTFYSTADSTRVYTNTIAKGVSGGFAVGQYGTVKGNVSNYLHITPDNYFIGHDAGDLTVPGTEPLGRYNIFMGYESGFANITGNKNTFLGHLSGHSNTTGILNVFLGNSSGFSNVDAQNNVFIGINAGYSNVGGTSWDGDDNIFIGNNAGYSNLIGHDNCYIGNGAGYSSTSVYNTIIGSDAGRNSDGNFNTLIGMSAGYDATGGSNTFIGMGAGKYNATGSSNVYVGGRTGFWGTTGNQNVFIGYGAGELSSGDAMGNGNVFIGYDVGSLAVGASGKLYIDNNSTDTPLIYGDFSANTISINGTFSFNADANSVTLPSTRGTSGYVLMTNGSGATSWASTSTLYDNDWTVAGSDLYSAVSGNVGIGTSTPGSHKIYVTSAGTTTTGTTAYIENTAPTGIAAHFINTSATSSDVTLLLTNKGTGNILNLDSWPGGVWERKFVFTNDGKLGIGTTSPIYKMQVEDISVVTDETKRAGYFKSQGGSNSGTAYSLVSYAYAYGASNAYAVYADALNGTTSGREYAFYGRGDGYFSGSVGIGTIAPAYKLQVAGDIAPTASITYDLGSTTLQWNNVYGTAWLKKSAEFLSSKDAVTLLIKNPIKVSKSSNKQVDNSSFPNFLLKDNFILTGEMTVFNYQVNYEQQEIIQKQQKTIEQLIKENEELKKSFNELKLEVDQIKNMIK